MKDNECRIIKIEKDALFEFIYENFIANHEELMDLDAVGCMNTFAIDWEAGELSSVHIRTKMNTGILFRFRKILM